MLVTAESRGLGCSEGLTRRVLGGGPLRVELRWAHAERRMALVAFEVGRVMTDHAGPRPFAGQFELLMQVMPMAVRGLPRILLTRRP